jgi:addiction module HigA family antidote
MSNKSHLTPVHPGEVLKDELEEIGMTQTALANHIGVLPKTVNEICRGKRGISADMAMRLSKALGGRPQFWLNLQNNWALSQLDEAALKESSVLAPIQRNTRGSRSVSLASSYPLPVQQAKFGNGNRSRNEPANSR